MINEVAHSPKSIKVPMPAHQILPLTGYVFEASYSTLATHANKILNMDQSEVLNPWAGIGTLTSCQLDQRMSILLATNKHRLQSLLLCFVLHMTNII